MGDLMQSKHIFFLITLLLFLSVEASTSSKGHALRRRRQLGFVTDNTHAGTQENDAHVENRNKTRALNDYFFRQRRHHSRQIWFLVIIIALIFACPLASYCIYRCYQSRKKRNILNDPNIGIAATPDNIDPSFPVSLNARDAIPTATIVSSLHMPQPVYPVGTQTIHEANMHTKQ